MQPKHKCPTCRQPLAVQTWETDDNLKQAMHCAEMAQGFIEYACPKFTFIAFFMGLLTSRKDRIESVRHYHACADLCERYMKQAISPNRLALQD